MAMYNLIMWGADGGWDGRPVTILASRFLEYTNDAIRPRFANLTDDVVEEIKSLPTLFTEELSTTEPARVGRVSDIQRRQGELRITYQFDPNVPPIMPEKIKELARELDIGTGFEMSRSHWAIKEVDLFEVLESAGIISGGTQYQSVFKYNRKTVIAACDLLKKRLDHADFDRLLLEIGLDHIDAGREKGGLQARSVALASYTVKNMDEPTVDGETLASVVIRWAACADPTYFDADDVVDPVRRAFWNGLRNDGYTVENAQIVRLAPQSLAVAKSVSVPPPPVPQPAVPTDVIGLLTGRASVKPKVFIVHGRGDALKFHVAHFLRGLEIDDVILHERPNGGRTIIAKFQEEAADIQFAVVLMTPDDVGGLKGEATHPRARQNVIFELGFFIGKLGANKVCALVEGDIEKPSDFDAVVYIPVDAAGAWKMQLAKELQHASVPFNHTKLISG